MKRKPVFANRRNPARLWGGRFRVARSEKFKRFNGSFSFDWELLEEDSEGSIAWALALLRADVLSKSEADTIVRGLIGIRREHRSQPPEMDGYEDVHTFVEAMLAQK